MLRDQCFLGLRIIEVGLLEGIRWKDRTPEITPIMRGNLRVQVTLIGLGHCGMVKNKIMRREVKTEVIKKNTGCNRR